MKFNRPIDRLVLDELRAHLLTAHEWANEMDGALDSDGFSCIKSVMEAVDMGRPGLALERWNDLSSRSRPVLTPQADGWKMPE